MKNLFKNSVLLVVLMALFVVGCEKDENGNYVINASMTATVDGKEWKSIFRTTEIDKTAEVPNIKIIGTSSFKADDAPTILLTANGTTEGTYNFDPKAGAANCTVVYKKKEKADEKSADYYVAYKANINITKINTEDKKISGTFSAELCPADDPLNKDKKIVISNGKFSDLQYSEKE